MKRNALLFILLFAIQLGYGQDKNFIDQKLETSDDPLCFVQIKTDTLFESSQIISLLILEKDYSDRFDIEFGYSSRELIRTSLFAENADALAAINGGFFNMDSGGSVSYFELNDSVISRTRDPELKWGVTSKIINGALIFTSEYEIEIETANTEQYYESSSVESAVLVTGPVLLMDSKRMDLPDIKFSNNRHPRTCLCQSEESLVFIAIDGRSEKAAGMSLPEVQEFLLSIGCIEAINLDGGGSTTMWTHDKGVVNFPSDRTGERPVANVLLILEKQ